MLIRLAFRSNFLLLLLSLLHDISLAIGCEEGELKLKTSSDKEFLQICHNEEWGYVCSSRFYDTVDGEVVLQQLNCTTGSTGSTNKNDVYGYRLHWARCAGVERRLMECLRYQNIETLGCKKKVTVICNRDGTPIRQCLNGELKNNETNNMLHICVSGFWRPLCSNFWGHSQATVACRQLNPGKTVFRATANYVQYQTQGMDIFEHPFYCTGQEMNMINCPLSCVPASGICNNNLVAGVECGIGSVSAPTELVLTPITSFTVEANWTQPASDSQQYNYLTISCTDELYTTTQYAYVNVSAAGNENMHMMISVLMPNTSYNCCVSVNTELGRSEEVCDHVTTGMPGSSSLMDEMSQSGTDLASAWVSGIIIGAVLATVTLFIVLAAVWMIRRRQHSKSIMPNNSKERIETFTSQTNGNTASSGVVNDGYYRPQLYEETQIRETEYSYAAHASDANIYDSVMEQSKDTHSGDYAESSFGADNNTDVLQEVKNSLYEGAQERGQETGVYSKLSQQ